MERKGGGKKSPPIDLARQLHLEWTPEKEAKNREIVFDAYNQEEARLASLPDKYDDSGIELSIKLAIRKVKMAKDLKMPITDFLQKKSEDFAHFSRIAQLARSKDISWYEAEKMANEQAVEGQRLLDKISSYHNSSKPRQMYPKEPRASGGRTNTSIYENRHKARRKLTKGDLQSPKWQMIIKTRAENKRAQIFRDNELTEEMSDKAFNVGVETEVDRFPEFGFDHD